LMVSSVFMVVLSGRRTGRDRRCTHHRRVVTSEITGEPFPVAE
jgi:hypothetical protein